MKPWLKILVLLEIVICFSPPFLLLALSIVVIPINVVGIISGDLLSLIPITISISGCLGVIGVIALVLNVLDSECRLISAQKAKIFILLGVFAVFGYILLMKITGGSINPLFLIFAAFPLTATIHFVYMARRYIFE